jgi:dolichyl-phosphate beta-glucosyltransferase
MTMGASTMAGEREPEAQDDAPELSLVIPAYNERERLPRTLRAIRRYLSEQDRDAEVIVVDDGSDDGTAELASRRAERWPALRVLRTAHGGKGHAVRAGLLAARGRYVVFCDADLSMPITELHKLLPPDGADGAEGMDGAVVIASREAPGARRYGEPLRRHLMGRAFNLLVRALALPGIEDSQCGFKCFRSDLARRLGAAQTLDGWGFDVELLYIARRWGYRVVEAPIEWHYAPSSRISPLRDAWHMTRDVWTVRRNARAGRYDAPREEHAVAAGVPGQAGPAEETVRAGRM